ncbi:MAG: hypothetical protein ACRDRX_23480 [Pseudonocardiaceae bacterium]
MSYRLTECGIDHVVLERDRIGQEWRERRWDSFCLVTPNWQCQLPGFPYTDHDPNGFMVRDEIVRYIEDFARSFSPPVIEGVAATRLRRDRKGRYLVGTSRGELIAEDLHLAGRQVHLAVGSAPRVARCYRGRDVVTWLDTMGYYLIANPPNWTWATPESPR